MQYQTPFISAFILFIKSDSDEERSYSTTWRVPFLPAALTSDGETFGIQG
jgi:hypothetical protein